MLFNIAFSIKNEFTTSSDLKIPKDIIRNCDNPQDSVYSIYYKLLRNRNYVDTIKQKIISENIRFLRGILICFVFLVCFQSFLISCFGR